MAQSKSYYQAYDDRYRQIHEQSLHWFSKAPSPIVLEIMNKYQVSKASAILEIGCGEGRDAAYLLQNGYPVLATDVSAEAVKYCRKQFPEYADSFQVLDCLTERLSGTYDFIYAISVLHILVEEEDRVRFYRFLYEQLQDEGIAHLSDPLFYPAFPEEKGWAGRPARQRPFRRSRGCAGSRKGRKAPPFFPAAPPCVFRPGVRPPGGTPHQFLFLPNPKGESDVSHLPPPKSGRMSQRDILRHET